MLIYLIMTHVRRCVRPVTPPSPPLPLPPLMGPYLCKPMGSDLQASHDDPASCVDPSVVPPRLTDTSLLSPTVRHKLAARSEPIGGYMCTCL